MLKAAMAAWISKSGWFLINYEVILDNNRGGYNVLCYVGNKLLCVETCAEQIKKHQWRLLKESLKLFFLFQMNLFKDKFFCVRTGKLPIAKMIEGGKKILFIIFKQTKQNNKQ